MIIAKPERGSYGLRFAMIIDHINHSDTYLNLSPRIAKGLEFLKALDFDSLQPGKSEIDGSSLYIISQEYETRDLSDGKWESHRLYADIQMVVDGEERIGYAPLESMTVKTGYLAERDCAIYEGEGDFIRFRKGTFGIFFPQDVHMPSIAVSQPSNVKKVVVKVLL
ncbi:MAG: YhcH/YjgK/YiaL family protein [Chthoniobacterales bacterium]